MAVGVVVAVAVCGGGRESSEGPAVVFVSE